MWVRHLRHAAIDRAAYDACVEAAPNGLVYGLSWWLDVVSPGWEALVADDYRAVLPLPVRHRYGIRFVEQPLFCQLLSVYSPKALHEAEIAGILHILTKRFRLLTQFNLNAVPHIVGQWALRHTHLLDLRKSYELIYSSYNPDRQQNLKRAKAEDWQIQPSHDIRPLIDWFQRFHAQNIRGGVAPEAYRTLENLFRETERRGLSKLWYVLKNGQPEAGAWFVTHKNRVIYLFNSATPAGRRGNARTFLLDAFFRENAGQNLIFDFESPEVPSIAGFYESFGAKPEPYVSLLYNHLPFWANELWRLKNRLIKKPTHWGRLPVD